MMFSCPKARYRKPILAIVLQSVYPHRKAASSVEPESFRKPFNFQSPNDFTNDAVDGQR